MSNEKTTTSTLQKTPAQRAVHGHAAANTAKPPAPEVVSLEIDESDFGGDPYNRTGYHCVLKLGDDA